MPLVHPHAAGIDLGNQSHFVCVPADSVPPGESPVREFGVFNPDLDQMVDRFKQCRVETVAMESTGVMWIPVFQKLEAAGLEVLLVNTKGLKHVPGRKSDMLDCQWIQLTHSYGLLAGSFRPADIICRVRTLMRQRENLVHSASRETQHMQKAMQEMGVHLHVVVADVTGDTGLRIIDAIVQGDWREELLFVLGQSRRGYAFFQEQLANLDEKMMALLAEVPEAPPPPAENSQASSPGSSGAPEPLAGGERPVSGSAEHAPVPAPGKGQSRGRKNPKFKPNGAGNPLPKDVSPQLAKIYGTDLTLIPGLGILGVLIILSEMGADLKGHWRSGDAFAAWMGLCPGSKISGGKVLSSRTPHVVNRAAVLLRLAAVAIGGTETCLGLFYRRIKARHGPSKAATATARKLAVLIYHLVTMGQEYQKRDVKQYDERVRKNRIIRLTRQAKDLGFDLVPVEKAA